MADYIAVRTGRGRPRGWSPSCWRRCATPTGSAPRWRTRPRREVPVIALKVGRTEGSKAMVTAHSGALAGEHGAFEALFDATRRARGAHARRDGRHDRAVRRAATRADGTRHREHPRLGRRARDVRRPRERSRGAVRARSRTTRRAKLQDTLDPGLVAENPLDGWGTGIDADRIFRESFQLLHDDPDTAAVAFVVDLTKQGRAVRRELPRRSRTRSGRRRTKPFCMLSNLGSAVEREEAAILRRAGIPVLEGTASGLLALRHLLDEGERHARPASAAAGARRRTRSASDGARGWPPAERSASWRGCGSWPTTACRWCRRGVRARRTRRSSPQRRSGGRWC